MFLTLHSRSTTTNRQWQIPGMKKQHKTKNTLDFQLVLLSGAKVSRSLWLMETLEPKCWAVLTFIDYHVMMGLTGVASVQLLLWGKRWDKSSQRCLPSCCGDAGCSCEIKAVFILVTISGKTVPAAASVLESCCLISPLVRAIFFFFFTCKGS